MESVLFYFSFSFILFILARVGEAQNRKGLILLSYGLLLAFSFFRKDIGNDYWRYEEAINYLALNFRSGFSLNDFLTLEYREPSYVLMTYFFHIFRNASFWVLGCYSIILIVLIYHVFDKFKVHSVGLFIYVVSESLFINWDQVRQSVAIFLSLLSVFSYVERRRKLVIVYFILAVIFHYSAVFVFPIALLCRLRIGRWFYPLAIGVLLFTGIRNFVHEWALSKVVISLPVFDTENSFIFQRQESEGYFLRMVLYCYIWVAVCMLFHKYNWFVANFLFYGTVLYLISQGALNMMRVSYYSVFIAPLLFAILLNSQLKLKARLLLYSCVLVYVAIFGYDIYNNKNVNGCVPYQSIFNN